MVTIDETLQKFMNITRKSKVAIIFPLFGYQKSQKSKQLDESTLKITLDRAYSSAHQVYNIFVGDEKSVSNKARNIILGRLQAGNCTGVHIPYDATYPEYIEKGIDAALHETDAEYIVIINPWIVLQHGAIDNLIERVNGGGDVSVVCGYDFRKEIPPEQFDDKKILVPVEEHALSFNALATKRYIAEIVKIDSHYKTRAYLERDVWQTLFSQGTLAIVSQCAPIFSFDVDFSTLETEEDKESDQQYFTSKWGFKPQL